MKLSKYVKLVKGGGYCMVAHVEDSGIWLGTRSAIFRATELPDMAGEEQVRTVLDMPEKAWEKVHFDERWEGTVKSIFGMNLSDYADGEQDTEKLKVMAAPDGLWCDCRRSMDDGELIFYREAMLSPLAEQIKESDYICSTRRWRACTTGILCCLSRSHPKKQETGPCWENSGKRRRSWSSATHWAHTRHWVLAGSAWRRRSKPRMP